MGARVLWEHEVAGSSPVTPTMRVSYIGNTLAFQASKVGSIPTTRSIFVVNVVQLVERQIVVLVVVGSSPIIHPM